MKVEEKSTAMQAKIDKMNSENLEVEAQFKEWNKSFEKERLTKQLNIEKLQN